MKRLLSLAVLVVLACTPDIANTPPPSVVVARFDPSLTPPLLPTPNDLATGADGFLAVPIPATATAADRVFYGWLNTLTGFPTSVTAATTFDAPLQASSVTGAAVKVLDLSDGNLEVQGVTLTYTDGTPSTVSVAPPAGGWKFGHRYAVAVLGGAGSSALKGASGQSVVATPTWALLRAAGPIVTCPGNDFANSAACALGTELIPSAIKDNPRARLLDQLATGARLEPLRLKYRPAVDAAVAAGIPRADLALLWTFKIDSSAQFNFDPAASPPVVPLPNDLAIVNGLVHAPVDPSSSPAYQEFTTDYLNTLNGFPVSATAVASIGNLDLDPATVNSTTVKVLTLRGAALTGAPTIAYSAATHSLLVAPPGGSWGKGHRFAVVAVGGPAGLKAVGGQRLVASAAMALATSAVPLADCPTPSTCTSLVPAAPISAAQAAGLEQLRLAYKSLVDLLVSGGLARKDIAGLWVFSTVDQPELTFDLAGATPVIPFPANQFLRQTDDVNMSRTLNFPASSDPLQGPLFAGLNTLNGFSLTAPMVSENSNTLAALDVGHLDGGSLATGTGFAKLQSALDAGVLTPDVVACLNCVGSTGATPQPEQLQWVPRTPLEENTRYAAWATTSLTDTAGRRVMAAPTFALVRLKNPLLDANGKSTLPVLADAQAVALEFYRLRFKDCLDRVEAQGVARKNIALGFCMTTQSTVSVIKQMAAGVAAPFAVNGLPDFPTMLVDVTALVAPAVPHAAISKIFNGNLVSPFALNGTQGTLNPNPAQWVGRKIPFILTVPAGAGPFKVVIFGHGLTGNRTNVYGIADTFAAAGFATIAIDVVYHGDRTTCVGSKAVTGGVSDDAACAAGATCDAASGRCLGNQAGAADCNPAVTGDADCFLAGQGQCQLTGKCENGDFLRATPSSAPAVNAWNYLNLANFFATRDNFRSTGPIDFTALVRLIQSTSAASLNNQLALAGAGTLNGANINYMGQSLGSFNGVTFGAANATPINMGFNVPGSDQELVLLTATTPSFAAIRVGFLAQLAGAGIHVGDPAFDSLMVLLKTILDPADPQTLVYDTVNSSNAARKVFLQYIEGDTVLPNPTTRELIGAAQRNPARQAQVFEFQVGANARGNIPASFPEQARHGFVLTPANNPDCDPTITSNCATVVAQTQLASFLLSGTATVP